SLASLIMPSLPRLLRDPISLADWLELTALEADDRTASTADLAGALRIANNNDGGEALLVDVMNEIEQRSNAATISYPFTVEHGRVLRVDPVWTNCIAYIFCLCLSYFGWRPRRGAPINPWLVFEDLSCLAAEQFIQGPVLKFGSRGGGRIAASFR